MQNYKESLHFNYFVGSGAIIADATKTTADLVPLQIGLFNQKNWKALVAPASGKTVPEIVIAMGSPNTSKIAWENAEHSLKSLPIQANRVIAYRKSLPVRPQQHKVAIGWDGVNACKDITAICDETYSLFIQVEGSPATRFFGAKPLADTFVYTTECCTECTSGCSADVEKMIDTLVGDINKSILSPFIKAEKLVDYTVDPSPTTVAYETFTLTIPDEGGVEDIAKLKIAYPSATSIVLQSRTGIYSTYLLTQPTATADPSAYTLAAGATIPDCTTCPSGYTSVPKFYKFKVQRQDIASAGNLTTIATDYPDGSTYVTPYRLSYVNGESTYVVYNTSATVPSAAAAGDIVTAIGFNPAYCQLTSALTYGWTAGDAFFKVQREMCLTIGDQPCDDGSNTAQLADLVAYYAGNSAIVADSIAADTNGLCANIYTVNQLSNNLLTSAECTTGIATFDEIPPYKGFTWKLCDCGEITENGIVNIGIVLTGVYVDTKFGECSFEYDDFVELDIPKIIVTQGDTLDELGKCATPWAVTELQKPVYPTGTGENVKRNFIEAMEFQQQCWSDSPRQREINGYNYDFIKRNSYYKFYYLEFESVDKYDKFTNYANDMKVTVTWAFEETVDTTNFEKLLESWIGSVKPELIDSDYNDSQYR